MSTATIAGLGSLTHKDIAQGILNGQIKVERYEGFYILIFEKGAEGKRVERVISFSDYDIIHSIMEEDKKNKERSKQYEDNTMSSIPTSSLRKVLETLEWYGETVKIATLSTKEGEMAINTLKEDRGNKARNTFSEVLERFLSLKKDIDNIEK